MLETRWENVVKLGQPRRTLGQRVLLQLVLSLMSLVDLIAVYVMAV